MKLLFITGQLRQHGGIERTTAMKLNSFTQQGIDVYLSTYEQSGAPFIYPISDKIKYTDIGVNYNVDYAKGESLYSFRSIRKIPFHIYKTYRLIRNICPDIIIVPNFGFEFWFLPYIKKKSKIIREYHDSQFLRNRKRRIKERIDTYFQKKYDVITVLTPQEVSYFSYQNNIKVIPNPVLESTFKSEYVSKKIISVGRVDPVKGFENLIDIASIVVNKHADWIFEIYGEGNTKYVNSLQNLINSHNLENNVRLKGKTSEVFYEMSQASVYLCTSKTESFGLTLIEAQEVGLPIVSFDCPNGPRNIVTDNVNGFLIGDNTAKQAADKLLLLIENTELRKEFGYNAMKSARRYHINKIANIWIDLFNNLI